MDVSGIGSLSTALSSASTSNELEVTVLKKAMQMDAQSAQQLIEALLKAPNNPPHLGNSVDVKA